MRAIVIEKYGTADELIEKEVPKPNIQENQVLLDLYASSVNPIDTKVRMGYLQDTIPFKFPLILGWDAAGIVRDIGSKVTQFQVGDEVFARAALENGTYAEYVAVEEDLLALKPQNIDFQTAAAVPLAGLMAWQCVVDFGNVQSGDRVLVHAGSGGVGSMAIQIAKYFGAYVLSTASGRNEELLKEFGVDECINYETTDFSRRARDVDLVVDTLGGDILDKSLDIVKPGGRLAAIAGQPDVEKARDRQITAESVWLNPNGKQLAQLGEMMENGWLMPYVGHSFPLTREGVREAHILSESHHARGKIVIAIK